MMLTFLTGPMPVLGDPGHAEIVHSLKQRVPKILKLGTADAPKAIIVVTAHWSEATPTISSGASHSLYYDYGGFPPQAYTLKYPAPGSPEVANQVAKALETAGFQPRLDSKRGWDHGVFIPFLLINPAANIPIVQLSVLANEDPREHLKMGQALAALRDENIAIVGSGFASFHNLPLMFSLMGGGDTSTVKNRAKAWNKSLTDAVLEEKVAEREGKLTKWRDFPHAYDMHPRHGAEHFMPLLVCAGAGGETPGKGYKDDFHGVDIWSYYWA